MHECVHSFSEGASACTNREPVGEVKVVMNVIESMFMVQGGVMNRPEISRLVSGLVSGLVSVLMMLVSGLMPVAVSEAAVHKVGPSKDWCSKVNKAKPGDEVLLGRGFYTRPCGIRVSGEPGNPIVIRSYNPKPGSRAVLVYQGSKHNVLTLREVHDVVLKDLDITAKSPAVEGIKIYSSHNITIERCRFHKLKGVSIAVNHGDSSGIVIRNNEFKRVAATPIYLGCHDGVQCVVKDAVIERNLIDGVSPPQNGGVGYGIQVKLNSDAQIRDNSVYVTKGPGIMVYGNADPVGPASLIEGNYVHRSATDGGIVLGGGPVMVRNNVVVDHGKGGIIAQDYQGRGLQHNIKILHNTLVDNLIGGVVTEGWIANRGNVISNNFIRAPLGQNPIKPLGMIAIVEGNVHCPTGAGCFIKGDRQPFDFRLPEDSEWIEKSFKLPAKYAPKVDFLGLPRQEPATPGAFAAVYPDEFASLALGGYKRRPKRVTLNQGERQDLQQAEPVNEAAEQ